MSCGKGRDWDVEIIQDHSHSDTDAPSLMHRHSQSEKNSFSYIEPVEFSM